MSLRTCSGFSLLEICISLMLLSLVLLGLDAMEVTVLRDNRATYFLTMASNQLQNISERLRVLGVRQGFAEQVALWNQENQAVLPQGIGVVQGAYPRYQATIFWGERKSKCQKNTLGATGCLIAEIQL